MSTDKILSSLNSSQRAAVTSPAATLAILAGPGSGKTHTLTSRTAWLLKHEGLQPWNIIVATFTVKAAREMKERIGRLIDDGLEAKLVLGTFHSIARRYLARYGHLIDIPKDFGIADTSDSLAIIKRIIKRHNLNINPSTVRSRISSRKAKGSDSNIEMRPTTKSIDAQEFETCYTNYEEALKRSNLLDYDDLLLRCVDLLRTYPSCVSHVEAVLIDEFQDTNLVQFDLMRLFASHKKRVTIVGDPDQSIYGFRSAETKNFKRLLRQYPETVTISLEENYRSSGAILLTALEVIQQDEGRIAKSLMPTHSVGTRPVLRKLTSAYVEAQWIISEIERCLALCGNLMNYDDIAILLRSASLSRHIESALGKAGIAYRMVGGHRFFDRFEVKIILDYMRVINQPDNNDAIARVINVPPRHVGDTTLKSLLVEADQSKRTLWRVVLDHIRGSRAAKTKITSRTEQGLSSFVNFILTAKSKFLEPASSVISATDLIGHILKNIFFEDFLIKTYPDDHASRLANVQELIHQASEFSNSAAAGDDDEEALPEVDGLPQDTNSSPLSRFLANIALASDAKAQGTSASIPQVTISTIHAAKGLEWPVVFIPAAYEGSIPHSRAEDADEERRLLYVAMTRAKALLYMSYPTENSQREQTALSPFLVSPSLKPYLAEKGPSLTSSLIQSVAQILNRPIPPKIDYDKVETLLSLEDDLFSVKGNDDIAGSIDWADREAKPHFTQGQRPPKRQRIDQESKVGNSRDDWRPAHSTTIENVDSFSTSRLTIKSGFVSAGSHLKDLKQGGVNCVVEKTARASKTSPATGTTDSGVQKTYNNTKDATMRSKRCVAGQGDISTYFSRPAEANAKPKVTATEMRKTNRSQLPQQNAPETFAVNLPQIGANSFILPSFATHRLGSALLPVPKRTLPEEDTIPNKPYIYLSSSPPIPERIAQEVKPSIHYVERGCRVELGTKPEHPGDEMRRMRPASSMHATTVTQNNVVAPPPRKSYGVRRDIKPWSSGGGRPFVPPSRSEGRPF